ncbi:MAG: DUF4199 domain-containing protein [Bacteroidales bacterium]|jgi:hypothetical protein|nr:DUF4199 domain-containing protein [Bacteroidales bacterium]MDD4385553.1 DUF4199 domain-containing protein [Bacteroidales bacterium]MDY0197553.1 DUF4199 domain-containing protein [Tenuifilaceae bacterium]
MNSKIKLLLKSTTTYGLALGVIVVIYSLLLYLLGIMPIGIVKPFIFFVVSVAIFFTGILIFSKKVSNEIYGGEVTFQQGLMIGILIGFFAAIITSAYSYLQNVIIDPEYMGNYINAQSEWMANYMSSKGISGDQIEKALEGLEVKKDVKITFGTYILSVLSSTFGFAIISLVTAAIIKKKKTTPFE